MMKIKFPHASTKQHSAHSKNLVRWKKDQRLEKGKNWKNEGYDK
jgi:hypothetical protein